MRRIPVSGYLAGCLAGCWWLLAVCCWVAAGWLSGWLSGCLAVCCWLAGCLAVCCWLLCWLGGWLVATGCLLLVANPRLLITAMRAPYTLQVWGAGWLGGWLAGWLLGAGWLAGWLAGWVAGRPAGWELWTSGCGGWQARSREDRRTGLRTIGGAGVAWRKRQQARSALPDTVVLRLWCVGLVQPRQRGAASHPGLAQKMRALITPAWRQQERAIVRHSQRLVQPVSLRWQWLFIGSSCRCGVLQRECSEPEPEPEPEPAPRRNPSQSPSPNPSPQPVLS